MAIVSPIINTIFIAKADFHGRKNGKQAIAASEGSGGLSGFICYGFVFDFGT